MPWRKERSTPSHKMSRNVPILERRKPPTSCWIGTDPRDKLQICGARYNPMNHSQHLLMVEPSRFTMRSLMKGLRQAGLLEKSWQSNWESFWYRPATGISRYGPMKSYRFTVGSIVCYKRFCCLSAAVLTVLRQPWGWHLKPSHECDRQGSGSYVMRVVRRSVTSRRIVMKHAGWTTAADGLIQ